MHSVSEGRRRGQSSGAHRGCDRRTSDNTKVEVRLNEGSKTIPPPLIYGLDIHSNTVRCLAPAPGRSNAVGGGCIVVARRDIQLQRPDGGRLVARVPSKHRMAGKGISALCARTLTGDMGLETPEIKLGESRGDLAVAPRNGMVEGYPPRGSSSPVGLGRRNSRQHIESRRKGMLPHDWAHSVALSRQLTGDSLPQSCGIGSSRRPAHARTKMPEPKCEIG